MVQSSILFVCLFVFLAIEADLTYNSLNTKVALEHVEQQF